jgi:hypothetical protein
MRLRRQRGNQERNRTLTSYQQEAPVTRRKVATAWLKRLCSESETKFQGLQTRIYGKNYGHWQYQQHHGNQHPDFSFTGFFH